MCGKYCICHMGVKAPNKYIFGLVPDSPNENCVFGGCALPSALTCSKILHTLALTRWNKTFSSTSDWVESITPKIPCLCAHCQISSFHQVTWRSKNNHPISFLFLLDSLIAGVSSMLCIRVFSTYCLFFSIKFIWFTHYSPLMLQVEQPEFLLVMADGFLEMTRHRHCIV